MRINNTDGIIKKFKNVRIRSGMTQAELAMRLGVHWCTISRFENGHYPMSIFRYHRAMKIMEKSDSRKEQSDAR